MGDIIRKAPSDKAVGYDTIPNKAWRVGSYFIPCSECYSKTEVDEVNDSGFGFTQLKQEFEAKRRVRAIQSCLYIGNKYIVLHVSALLSPLPSSL